MTEPKIRFKADDGSAFPDWEEKTLDDIAIRVTRKNRNNETDIPLTISSLDGLVDQRTYFGKTVASKDMSGYFLLKNGEFAYNKSYSVGYDYGSIKRLDNYEQGALSTLYICFSLNDNKMSDYMVHYFNSLVWNREMPKICAEGARNHGLLNVSPADFFKINISLPVSTEEQKKIADFLSNVDEVIAASEEEVANLEQQKKAVMQKIFSQEVRFKKEDGSDFPDWDEKTFEELAKYKKGPFGSALKKEIFVPEGSDTVKVYEQQNAIGKDWTLKRYFITAEYYKKMQSFEVHAGDIIVSCAGTIGEIYILPENAQNGVINQALMRVRENKAVVNQVYFTYIFDQMLSQEGQKLSNGSALKNIPPFADMKKQVVKVPSLPEQQLIADFLTKYDEAITAAKQELAKWRELKKGLLQQMFV